MSGVGGSGISGGLVSTGAGVADERGGVKVGTKEGSGREAAGAYIQIKQYDEFFVLGQ